MQVLLTIDVEVHPGTPNWRGTELAAEIEQYIDGRTPGGSYGLAYQLGVLKKHRLSAVFFVEALAAIEAGRRVLEQTVSSIRDAGHEVQLHIHTEWLSYLQQPFLDGRIGTHMRDFSEDDQARLVARGLQNLADCGVSGVSAFRAGNYGADTATLRALARSGIRYDSSWNAAYLRTHCGLDIGEPLYAPRVIEGVWEVPIAFFEDYPGHVRHAQLAACSFAELRYAMRAASAAGWPTFVIVGHSFELVWRGVRKGRQASPRRLVIRRFERLCQFLAEQRDALPTGGFGDLALPTTALQCAPVKSPRGLTVARVLEQLAGRLI